MKLSLVLIVYRSDSSIALEASKFCEEVLKEKKFLNNLKRGDRIITKSGVHARITEFDSKSNTCIVETMAGKLKIEKSAISLELSSNIKT